MPTKSLQSAAERPTSRESAPSRAVSDEFTAWMAKYGPVERAIFEARERRLARKADRARQFGDLCEATEGHAKAWRAQDLSLDEQIRLAEGDVWTLQCLAAYYGRSATRTIDSLRHRLKRPLYYEQENARRRALAAERRRINRRTTTNPCPTKEQILDAWIHLKDSHEATIQFGSLLEDLACYVDSSLRFDESGNICGRCGGVKAWLQENIPALALRYTTVMRYKALAHKLKQIAEIGDPTPAAQIVGEVAPADSTAQIEGDGKPTQDGCTAGNGNEITLRTNIMPVALVRARAIWCEVVTGVRPNPTALAARIDALVDPERVEEATMLAEWRARYANEITERTKKRWWKRLCTKIGVA